ncbi:unnamed protein product, partial [Laminaria digitata]
GGGRREWRSKRERYRRFFYETRPQQQQQQLYRRCSPRHRVQGRETPVLAPRSLHARVARVVRSGWRHSRPCRGPGRDVAVARVSIPEGVTRYGRRRPGSRARGRSRGRI